MSSRFLAFAALALLNSALCYAGGPAFVAGSGFSPGVEGQPIVWANSVVSYFTDQGDLSPILPAAQADAFVAAAIAPWTSAPGVSLTATLAGHLAEDVNGSNIQASVSGVITSPVDITSSATSMPLGVVYDYDGSVTDAVLGAGAGSLGDCFSNAVYGGPDNFAVTGNIAHALIIINGVCASASTQLPDVQYRLVRILGRVFGLGWSQANLNVQRASRLQLPRHRDRLCHDGPQEPGVRVRDVLLILPERDSPVLTRELVYTGITRARGAIEIWAAMEIFSAAVSRRTHRVSGLNNMLWGRGFKNIIT